MTATDNIADLSLLNEEIYLYATLTIQSQCSDIFWNDIYGYYKERAELDYFYKMVSVFLTEHTIKIVLWSQFEDLMTFYTSTGDYGVG